MEGTLERYHCKLRYLYEIPPEEKGNPQCLKRLYQTTRGVIENNIALLVEQAMDRLLEQEQLSVGWEEQ